MEKIEDKLWRDHHLSSLRFDTRLSTEPIILDNQLVRICLQTARLNVIEENDNGVYVVWLTNEENIEDQFLKGRNIKIFHSNDTLIDFISELPTSSVFLIIDHELISIILSFLDNFSQIVFIYVLTNEKSNNTLVISDSRRSVRKISNDKEELSRMIIEDIDTCTKDSICSTIFDLTTKEESTNQTKNTSFIWYYLLIESLFDTDAYNDKAKSDLIQYCREQYSLDNIQQQNFISKFENEYSSENAIQWYTRYSFIYRQLNKALRTRDIDAIFKFRFFIIDFQKQLEQHYNEEVIESLKTVYRGQLMSQLELDKLKNSLDKYISLNTYLSATKRKDLALFYAGETTLSVLFEIEVYYTVNLKNKRTCPVYVQDKSYFPEEFEVIFPIGSTFHVDSVQMEDQQWHIRLKLTDDNQMIDPIQTYMKNVPSKVKFAHLLFELGDYEKAERYIEMLIEDLELAADNINVGYAYGLLGQIWSGRGDYQCALPYFEKALNNIPSDNVYLATIYRHFGCLHRDKTEFDIALKYLYQSLEYKEQMDLLELAELYEAFGSVYGDMKNFDDALFYVNQALTIRQSTFSTNNVLGSTYAVLAPIYAGKSDYTEALQFSTCALNMLSEIVLQDHPILILTYAYIGHIYIQCKDLSSAMIYTQKALYLIKTADQKQNLNPLVHILIYGILHELYNANKDMLNALYYAQQAYNIYKRFKSIIPETRSMIRTLHNNLGAAYYNVCDFTLALNFFLQALNLHEDMDDKIMILCEIGQIYLDQGDTKMAGQYLNDLPQLISQRKQPVINYDTHFCVNYNISRLYELENNLEKSIFYIKEALRLEFEQTNKNYDHIVLWYAKIMELCPEEKKEHIAEVLEIVENHGLSINSKILAHNIVGHYHKKQNDLSNALHHFQLSLNYELTCIPSRCEDLITIYSAIGSIYTRRWKEKILIQHYLVMEKVVISI